jgi:hypothetical protein
MKIGERFRFPLVNGYDIIEPIGEDEMSLMISGLYDALLAAGSPEAKAREAATEVASYDNRLANIESDMKLLKWMVGFNIAVSMTMLFKLFM